MSMRAKTTMSIILIVFLATAATFFSGLYFTGSSMEETMEQDLAFAIGIADSLVATQLRLMKTEAATVASRLSAAADQEELSEIIVEQFNDYDEISALSVFDRNGVIASYSVPQHDHDMSGHSQYIEMVYNGASVVTSPFYCPTRGEFVLNVYTPMSGGRVLAATMPGLTFSDLLARHRLWQTGDIFMVNEEGTFVGAADQEIVLAMQNYIKSSQAEAAATGEERRPEGADLARVINNMLSAENGVDSYRFGGQNHLCAYSRIEESMLGWRVAVSVPLEESPQADAMRGHLYSAMFFLASGVGAAFFVSKLTEKPFKKIEAQNRDLEELNATIRSQADAILEEHERVKLMLDATPLACRLWSRDHELLECNEEAVKLFNLKDKQEYMDRYLELSPEYQPDGQPTLEKMKALVSEAFEKGASGCEWMYRLPGGSPLPAELRLVRVRYENDYVVAAYSRDLREQKKMIADIEHRDNLLNVAHRTSFILFDTAEDKNIETVLGESMELLGRSVGAGQVYIAQNEAADGPPRFTCRYAWAEPGDENAVLPGMKFPYGLDADWDRRFAQGQCMNGPADGLPPAVREFFASFGAQSVLVIPIFVHERFWGLTGFSDRGRKRSFGDDEVSILRSMSLMMVAAMNRSAQAASLREAHNRVRLLTNATPLGFNLWDKDFNNIDTNDTAVNLFGLSSHQEYLERFFELSPERQPSGRLSRERFPELLGDAFRDGWRQFQWVHQKLDGTPIPSEVTLVRLAYEDDYVVAGYIRDIREHKIMIAEIEQRDRLLQTVNQAADVLLRSEPGDFSNTLSQCMGMMARAIDADRMYLCKNTTENGALYWTKLYEWPDAGTSPQAGAAANISYETKTREVIEALTRGECVQSLVRDLPPADRARLEPQGVLSVLIVPILIRNEFWGYVGFNKCRSERPFSENEESIMHSGSLLIANALLRNEYMQSISDTSLKLESALEEARKANNAKGEFLANMSHEMRTPLNAIIGLSEVAVDNSELDHDTKSYLEKIYNSGSTLLSIVNDILDISKIQAGKFVIMPNQYDVPSMLNDAVLQNVMRIGSKPVRFELNIDGNMPARLWGDELRIKQIINNLLSNSIKYTEEGTVEFTISAERGGDSSDDVWLTVRVSDTGVGMRPEHLENLFTDYSQFGATSMHRAGGTGLGLAITKSLAEMMDGGIVVESSYGEGSVFTVRLRQGYVSSAVIGEDVAESLRRFQYSTTKLNHMHLNRIRLPYASVMVVDDNLTNLDVARGLMKPYGMRVDCVTGGRAAVRAVREEEVRYSAIFMDHMMPEMDGIETTRVIREEIGTEYAQTVPIIALTANAISGSEAMFLSKGFQGFISKPIEVTRLDDMLRRFVRDRDQEALLGDSLTEGEDGALQGPSLLDDITIDGIDMQKALERFGGDEAVFIDVLRSYAANTMPILYKLREDLTKGDFDDYAIAIHGLKGSSYSIFAHDAGSMAETLEAAAKTGDFNAVKIGHLAFEENARALLNHIEGVLAEVDSAAVELRSAAPKEYADFTAPDAEILIVDDNDTNRKAALGMLKSLQMSIDTAENGKEALRMIAQKQYHLIFMDHMMPVMDGTEAVMKLRQTEGEYYQAVPVIALTANDAPGAVESFLQAGMNDFITKPFEMKDIWLKLKLWLPADLIHERRPDEQEPPEPPRKDLPVIDGIDGIDVKEGIRYSGTRELFISLLGDFYKLIDMKAAKIEKCLADGLIRDVTIEVHALKNTARMIGAGALSEDFRRLEQYGNEGDAEALARETPAVLELYRSFKPALRPFGEAAESEKKEASREELTAILRDLISAMDNFDLDAADGELKRLEELRLPEECRTQMETLRAYMADVAMEDVMKLAEEMIKVIEERL